MSSARRPIRESATCSGGHQRTSVRAAAAGAAGHSGPDTGLQVHVIYTGSVSVLSTIGSQGSSPIFRSSFQRVHLVVFRVSQEQADDGSWLPVWRRRPAAPGRRPRQRETGGGQTGHRPLGDTVSHLAQMLLLHHVCSVANNCTITRNAIHAEGEGSKVKNPSLFIKETRVYFSMRLKSCREY